MTGETGEAVGLLREMAERGMPPSARACRALAMTEPDS